MTGEFDRVRAAFWSSLPARLLIGLGSVIRSAWRASFCKAKTDGVARALSSMSSAQRIQVAAIAGGGAAGLQPLLMWMMPETVRPAMPLAVFFGVVLIAAFVAWQATPLARFLAPDRPASDIG